jgi:hypothetical protein
MRAVGENSNHIKYYNEVYRKLTVERKASDLVLKSVNIDPELGLTCGDEVSLNALVKNFGDSEQYFFVLFESSGLELNQKSDAFKVGSYEDDDETRVNITYTIPNSVKEGNYTIKVSLPYESNSTIQKEIIIDKCKTETTEIKQLETIKIQSNNEKSTITSPPAKAKNKWLIGILGAMLTVLMVVVFVSLIVYIKKVEEEFEYSEQKKIGPASLKQISKKARKK